MTDPAHFKAPWIDKERIRHQADALRDRFAAGRCLPVRVLDIAEFDLGMEIIPEPGLREQLDTEAILLGDLRSILVDKQAFLDPRALNRLHFSVAHEIGHRTLHAELYVGIEHADAKDWFDFISAIPEAEYRAVEWQANEFAGRFLVPRAPLVDALSAAVRTARDAGYRGSFELEDPIFEFLAGSIGRIFAVSGDVVERRLRYEKLWPPPTA